MIHAFIIFRPVFFFSVCFQVCQRQFNSGFFYVWFHRTRLKHGTCVICIGKEKYNEKKILKVLNLPLADVVFELAKNFVVWIFCTIELRWLAGCSSTTTFYWKSLTLDADTWIPSQNMSRNLHIFYFISFSSLFLKTAENLWERVLWHSAITPFSLQ